MVRFALDDESESGASGLSSRSPSPPPSPMQPGLAQNLVSPTRPLRAKVQLARSKRSPSVQNSSDPTSSSSGPSASRKPGASSSTRRTSTTPTRNSTPAASSSERRRSQTPSWLRPRGSSMAPGSSSDISEEEAGSDTASDSEEELWPVGPESARSVSRAARARAAAADAAKARDHQAALVRDIRMASTTDAWDSWDRHSRANVWAAASRRVRQKTAEALEVGATQKCDDSEDLEDVRGLLEGMRLRREGEARAEKEAFDQRNKALWENIEKSILAAEQEAQSRAKEEAQRLAASRAAQAAAEQRAKEAREAEERRIAREKEEAERLEREQKAEEERLQKEAEKAAEENKKRTGPLLKVDAKKDWERWTAEMKRIKEQVLPVISNNPEWRKQCFAAKRQITPKVSQLTNSRSEVIRITTAIGTVLSAARNASTTGEIYTWILNHLSKCLIRQAEQEVAAKQDMAFPLARVVVWLILEGHTQLADVLMARLTKKCCWVLGFVPDRPASMDEATYGKLIGRAAPDEASLQFTARMCAILAFYSAVCTTAPTAPPAAQAQRSNAFDASLIPAHLRPAALWTWQARCITPPMTDHGLTPALWATFLEVAGPKVLVIYGRQTAKLWRLLLQEGIHAKRAKFVSDDSANAASMRLKLLLEGWASSGGLPSSKGAEMDP